jgi:HK97 family phage major capsid protein
MTANSVSTGFGAMVTAGLILGRLPVRTVPLNSVLPVMTTGGTAFWAGENLSKPLSAGALAAVPLTFFKAESIFVVSKELLEMAIPGADVFLRDELKRVVTAFLDAQAFDASMTELANGHPGSLTNGAPSRAATATTAAAALTDIKKLITDFTAQNPNAENLWLLMTPAIAAALAVATNSQTLTVQGGTLFGCNVLTSTNVGAQIVMLDPSQIYVAQEPGIRLDISTQTNLQMADNPVDPVVASTVFTSLWQKNLVAIRAEKLVAWKRARTNAVRLITSVGYV